MKRCPSCNRTYTNDAQRFCTIDGTPLVDAQSQSANLGETIRIDSAGLNVPPVDTEDEVTKVISGKLPSQGTGDFDPYKTVIAGQRPSEPPASRDTQNLTPPGDQTPSSGSLAQSTSGPIQSPTTSAPLPPPAQPTPSHPTTSAPLPQAEAGAPAPIQQASASPQAAAFGPATTARPAKKSKLPLILGILAVLFVLGVGVAAAGYWFVVRPMLAKRAVVIAPPEPQTPMETPTAEPTTSAATPTPNQVNEVPAYSPPSDAVQFVNSKDNLEGKLAEHYVDFSFYYPESWRKDPTAGVPGASNFAKVERRLPPDFTQENFAVGWYSSAGSAEGDAAVFPTLAENLSAQFASKFADYRKVSEGPTKVGPYDGYEFRFESVSRNTDKGDIKIWGRVIFLPPVNGGKDGVTLLMLATSLAHELRSVNDVGVKGDLPMVLESFRFEK